MATGTASKKLGKGRHLSAYKRERQNEKRRARNKSARSSLRTAIKTCKTAPSKESLAKTIPAIDKAATKGLIPKKRAARMVSRLTKTISKSA